MTVLLVAAKRDFIQDRLKMMTDLGLETELVDVDIFSLYNAFEKYRDPAVAPARLGHRLRRVR
jgi:Tfp pilus assembly PilM family ATPase